MNGGDVYGMFTGVGTTAKFIDEFARTALSTATQTLNEMRADDQPHPDVYDIRDHAEQFVKDMFGEFLEMATKRIREIPFHLEPKFD